VIEAVSRVRDPEIPVNIYDMGLIYDIAIDEDGGVSIKMTLTAPGCPAAVYLPLEVEHRVRAVPGVSGVRLEIVWDPPWTPDRMSEAARLQLGLY
jgi:FeS assembly SUF system protein